MTLKIAAYGLMLVGIAGTLAHVYGVVGMAMAQAFVMEGK